MAVRYQQCFETDAGQDVLRDLLRFSGVDRECMTDDPNLTSYNLGKRRVGLRISKMMRTDPQDLLKELGDGQSASYAEDE